MTQNNRTGDVPDGAIIVKEQYGFTPPYKDANEWTVMVRDSTGAADGWFWADLVPNQGDNSVVTDEPCDEPSYPASGYGQYCINCHGSAAANQNTYATDQYVKILTHSPAAGAGAVCHRISAVGLGTSATYTGLFNLNDGSQLNGPFQDVATLPMQNAINMEPVEGQQITSSEMCGTCHTIMLPVYKANGEPVIDSGTGKQKTFTEQATFFEWQNSNFRDGGPQAQSCQECHMPNIYLRDGVSNPLSYKIANIEDNTFPAINFRAPDADITLTTRDGYRRHLLLGINLFALEMFKQFRNELGLYESDPMLRPSLNTDKGIDTAIDTSTNMIAKLRTADVKIESAAIANSQLTVDVRVTNKAGHSFPSGVGFRRAFVNLQVLNSSGQVIWSSGSLAPPSSAQPLKGLIVDGAGQPLVTETFTPTQQTTQPHYWAENPITRQDQVQIYEELVRNPEGFLSTSFIALNEKAKDNRLQPQGWSVSGAHADDTKPVGVCVSPTQCDPQYTDGSGSNVVRYIVPAASEPLTVRATLYYQTIPPYYHCSDQAMRPASIPIG